MVETKGKSGEAEGVKSESQMNNSPKRRSNDSVLVVRLSASIPWYRIESGLSSLLKNQHGLSPYADDKAII